MKNGRWVDVRVRGGGFDLSLFLRFGKNISVAINGIKFDNIFFYFYMSWKKIYFCVNVLNICNTTNIFENQKNIYS